MQERKAPGVRARVRAELTVEIKRVAREQLAVDGAAGISLRAVARELGMASSAVYRYFASREELLTALIIDAYNASGQLVEEADAACDRSDLVGRFVAMALTLRQWALDNPHEYALIYGSPVPGYAAPQDTIDPATRMPIAILSVIVEAAAGTDNPQHSGEAASELGRYLGGLMDYTAHEVVPSTLAAGVSAWAELFGLISLELFGHFNNVVTEPEAFFAHATQALAARLLG